MPLPLLCHRNGETRAGTGFLVKGAATGWLVTCAHLVTGLADTPAQRNAFLGGSIDLLATRKTLPLFAGRTPRFTFAASEGDGLLDVIALRLPPWDFAPLAGLGSHDLATIGTPSRGDEVSATGYAGLEADPVPPTVIEARIAEIAGPHLTLDVPFDPAMAGSPLVRDGTIVGMVCGGFSDTSEAATGRALSIAALGPTLFGD